MRGFLTDDKKIIDQTDQKWDRLQKKIKGNSKSIGLKKMNQTIEKNDTSAIRGMIEKVSHLLEVIEK